MIKLSLLIILYSFVIHANFNFTKDLSLKTFDFESFRNELTQAVLDSEQWPESIKVNDRKYEITYTFNETLTDYVKSQLRKYSSDYASVVVIDNNTGEVLTAVDYTRSTREFSKKLAFAATSPAASVFKVITAADLLENTEVSSDTKFSYNGKATTLYKYQLKDKNNKWTRSQDFEKAFARSNNVIFGKAALKNSSIQSLFSTANKFGFNENLTQVIDFGSSILFSAQTDYNLAELASGFNKGTMISPLHGAVISSIIANDGVMKKPHVVKSVKDVHLEREVWQPSYILSRAVSKNTVKELQDMMELTVKRGTARGAFRPNRVRDIQEIEIGGKTGSITGGLPYGKRDWFVSYAKPKSDQEDKGISVCVMIVNVEKWYIKSPYLAKNIIQYYYNGSSK